MGDALGRRAVERRLFTNSAMAVASRGATAAISLAAVPVVVTQIGIIGYGVWEALLALVTLSSSVQSAISGALVWRASSAFGAGRRDEIARMVRVGIGLTGALAMLVLPLVWLGRLHLVRFLNVPADLRADASTIVVLAATFVLLGGVCEAIESVISGTQRSGYVNVVTATALLANYTVVIVAALSGLGLWSMLVGQAAGFVVRLTGGLIAVRRTYGPVNLAPTWPSREDLRVARYSGLIGVGNIAALLRDQTDKLVLASLASPAWVGYYGIASRLASLVLEINRFFYVPVIAATGALSASGDWEGVRRVYERLTVLVALVSGLLVVAVAGLVDRLIVAWLGAPMPEASRLLWYLVIGNATAAMLTGVGTALCRGCGRVEIETTYLMVNLVLNVVLTVTLVVLVGPSGTAIATGATWAISSVVFLLVLHRRLDLPTSASRHALGGVLSAGVIAALTYAASSFWEIPTGRMAAFASMVPFALVGSTLYVLVMAAGRPHRLVWQLLEWRAAVQKR